MNVKIYLINRVEVIECPLPLSYNFIQKALDPIIEYLYLGLVKLNYHNERAIGVILLEYQMSVIRR